MPSVNKVHLIGNLTRDPEVRNTPNGTAVCDISLAINRVRKGENGEKIEEVTFVDVTLWGRTAEVAGQYLAKGQPAYIEGRLQLDTWEDKATGDKRSKLKVIGESLQLLSGPSQGAPQEQKQLPAPPTRPSANRDIPKAIIEDDIPF